MIENKPSVVNFVPATSSTCRSGQLEMNGTESSSIPVLLRMRVCSGDGSGSLSVGSNSERSGDPNDGMAAKFNFLHRLPTCRTNFGSACIEVKQSLVFPTRLMFSRCSKRDKMSVRLWRTISVNVMADEFVIDNVEPCRDPRAPSDRVFNRVRRGSIANSSKLNMDVDVRSSFRR